MTSASMISSQAHDGQRGTAKIVAVDIVPRMNSVKRMTVDSDAQTHSTVPATVHTIHPDDDDHTDNTMDKPASYISDGSDITDLVDSETKGSDSVEYYGGDASSRSPAKRSASILKRTSIDCYISEKRGSWISLPKPDMEKIRCVSLPITQQERDEVLNSRRVQFTNIQVRSYRQTLGDNPSVSYGPPISLDWSYEESGTLDLEEYETTRGPRRTLRQMMLNYYHRKALLTHKVGASEEDQKEAERGVNRIKRERYITRSMLPCRKFEEIVQSAGRKARKLAGGGGGKKNAKK